MTMQHRRVFFSLSKVGDICSSFLGFGCEGALSHPASEIYRLMGQLIWNKTTSFDFRKIFLFNVTEENLDPLPDSTYSMLCVASPMTQRSITCSFHLQASNIFQIKQSAIINKMFIIKTFSCPKISLNRASYLLWREGAGDMGHIMINDIDTFGQRFSWKFAFVIV